jgi:hypothetical protein
MQEGCPSSRGPVQKESKQNGSQNWWPFSELVMAVDSIDVEALPGDALQELFGCDHLVR